MEPGLLLSPGGLPGCGDGAVWSHCAAAQTGAGPESPASAGGGRAGVGAGRQVTLPCPGPEALARGRDTPLTLHPARI